MSPPRIHLAAVRVDGAWPKTTDVLVHACEPGPTATWDRLRVVAYFEPRDAATRPGSGGP